MRLTWYKTWIPFNSTLRVQKFHRNCLYNSLLTWNCLQLLWFHENRPNLRQTWIVALIYERVVKRPAPAFRKYQFTELSRIERAINLLPLTYRRKSRRIHLKSETNNFIRFYICLIKVANYSVKSLKCLTWTKFLR